MASGISLKWVVVVLTISVGFLYITQLAPVIIGSILRYIAVPLARMRLPLVHGNLQLSGLHDTVEIIRDSYGVPHIYAKNQHDAFMAQGFVHAQDRLWQLESTRRVVTGRVAEFVGPDAVPVDKFTRTFGFTRLAKKDLASIPQQHLALLQAYLDGLNGYLSHQSFQKPVEFDVVGITPANFTALDMLAFSRFVSWQMSEGWEPELIRSALVKKVGVAMAGELEIVIAKDIPVHLPGGVEMRDIKGSILDIVGKSPYINKGLGSNAWAISGSRTATGRPIIANDPHLVLSTPSIWYENHISVEGGIEMSGVIIPGFPGILIGHNQYIAWGITLSFVDMEDMYIEKFADDEHYYTCGDQTKEADVKYERILVKGAEPIELPVVITRHGPIVSELLGERNQKLAYSSRVMQATSPFEAVLRLCQARNWDEFVDAVAVYEAPSLNLVYGDVDGNIGYYTTGTPPIRKKGFGAQPMPGHECDDYEWNGAVSFRDMPHALNPKLGYIVSTNQPIVSADWNGPFLSSVFMNGYRAKRIDAMLAGSEKHSLADSAKLQLDVVSLPGKEFVTEVVKRVDPDTGSDAALALRLLNEWDYELTVDSVGGTVYEVTRYKLLRLILEPALGEELTIAFMGNGSHPLFRKSNEFYGHDTVALLRMLRNPSSKWIERAGGNKGALITRALTEAVVYLRRTIGQDWKTWRWGALHRIVFPHGLGAVTPLNTVFNLGGNAIGGDMDTVMQTGFGANSPFAANTWAPSYRQVIDVGNWDASTTVCPPGQSGHLASDHYDDQLDMFLRGDQKAMLWSRQEVVRNAFKTLQLAE